MLLRYALRGLAAAAVLLALPPAQAQLLYRADLAGANEVPPVTTTATGLATAVLDGSTLIVRGQFDGLESDYTGAAGSHVHQGAAGSNGPVVFALSPVLSDDDRSGVWRGVDNRFTDLTGDQITQLALGNFYVNVHSQGNPGGEVRGQLLPTLSLNEVRRDQPSSDVDEYVEIAGPAGASLDGFSFVVLGDGSGDNRGVIEEVIDLTGQTIPADGYFLMGELTLATADLVVDVNLENNDTVTYLLVEGVAGTEGDDLDADDDGVLDTVPWSVVADAVGSVDDSDAEGAAYAAQLGFVDLDVGAADRPAHLFRNRDDGVWRSGIYEDFVFDTPGEANASTSLVQVVHNAPGIGVDDVDVIVDTRTVADDLAYREATPFGLFPAGTPTTIEITDGEGGSPIFTLFDFEFEGSRAYYAVVAEGPGGGTDFDLVLYGSAELTASTPDDVGLMLFHGTPTPPTLDVRFGTTQQVILFDDVPFGGFETGPYQPFAPATTSFDLTAGDGTYVTTVTPDFTGLGGQTALLLTAGELGATGDDAFSFLVVQTDGTTTQAGVSTSSEADPAGALALETANPVRGETEVRFSLASAATVQLDVYDALGRRVATLAEGALPAGPHAATLDASRLSAGTYLVRLQAGDARVTQTVTVVR